jgi:hypothetical protein
MDSFRSVLEKAVCESPGRGAHVEADFVCDIYLKDVQGSFELEAALADVARLLFEFDVGVAGELGAGFIYNLPVDAHVSGEDGALGLSARAERARARPARDRAVASSS